MLLCRSSRRRGNEGRDPHQPVLHRRHGTRSRSRAPHAARRAQGAPRAPPRRGGAHHRAVVGGDASSTRCRSPALRRPVGAMKLENLGLIGNCQCSALVSNDRRDRLVLPAALRLGAGVRDAARRGRRLVRGVPAGRTGRRRSATSPTPTCSRRASRTADGSFRVIDFAPRFAQHERFFRPTQLHRIVEPLDGTPRVCVRCDPRLGWSKARPAEVQGRTTSGTTGIAAPLRLTTDIPLSYLEGRPFALTERRHLVLTWGAPIEEPLAPLASRFSTRPSATGSDGSSTATIPPLYQHEVIRSALALKLHCFEDTGAIVAAMTTSIPEAPGSGRTWDYRYCWLRDAYYALSAFRLLGHFEEREHFLQYLLNIAVEPSLARPRAALSRRRPGRSRGAHPDDWTGLRGRRTRARRQRRRAARAARRLRRDGARARCRSTSTSASPPSARRACSI